MGLFTSTEFNSLDDLFLDQIQDLYDAEQRLMQALPKMIDAAMNSELAEAFSIHLTETKEHLKRLEQVFDSLGTKPKAKTCEAMKGLISEGEEMLEAKGDHHVRDAALIAAAQRIEHYEIAAYGTVRNLARQLGYETLASLLQRTLDEAGAANKKLTEIAESSINPQAARA